MHTGQSCEIGGGGVTGGGGREARQSCISSDSFINAAYAAHAEGVVSSDVWRSGGYVYRTMSMRI